MNVICHQCDVSMDLTFQAKDEQGIDTFVFHCPRCTGRVAVQDENAKPPALKPIKPEAQHELEIELGNAPPPSVADVQGKLQPARTIEAHQQPLPPPVFNPRAPSASEQAANTAQGIAKILLKP
jgi:hypothetical protein